MSAACPASACSTAAPGTTPTSTTSHDTGERVLEGWSVQLYRNGQLERTTHHRRQWRLADRGVGPERRDATRSSCASARPAPAATTAARLAHSVFRNDLQRIHAITVQPGSNLLNLNLPIEPNGVVYDSIKRAPIAGARLRLLDAARRRRCRPTCFDDPAQQGQVTQREASTSST